MSKWWRFRRWFHKKRTGHKPDYFIRTGSLTGTPYVFCHVCIQEGIRKQKEWEDKVNDRLG